MKRRIGRFVRQNMIALLALFLALGGTSFAAAKSVLPANSVGTRQVINHSLQKIDFANGQLPRGQRGAQGLAGARGPTGAAGVKGDAGPKGDEGPPGPVALLYRNSGAHSLPAGQTATQQVTCPPDWFAVGGGVIGGTVTVKSSDQLGLPEWPTNPGSGWTVTVTNTGATDTTFQLDVICTLPDLVFTSAADAKLRQLAR